uniref:rolling circle replication-associated protein n=1 Tax=Metabacillus idriensis TaxID=324768 RepID=UPI00174A58D7
MEQLDKVREVCLKPSDIVTVTTMNHIVEVQHLEKMNQSAKIKKINKNTYMVLETGEIKEFEHIENRSQSYNSLRQTFKKLRYLINNNFVGKPNEIHLTLTYKENMTDTKQLYSDYEKFIKRLRYEYKNLSTIDYINVIEPQARGAWHSHTLLRFNGLDKVYLKNSKIAELWGNGFVTIKSLKDIDNIGAYLSAYLADVELTEENLMAAAREKSVIELKVVEGQEKK